MIDVVLSKLEQLGSVEIRGLDQGELIFAKPGRSCAAEIEIFHHNEGWVSHVVASDSFSLEFSDSSDDQRRAFSFILLLIDEDSRIVRDRRGTWFMSKASSLSVAAEVGVNYVVVREWCSWRKDPCTGDEFKIRIA